MFKDKIILHIGKYVILYRTYDVRSITRFQSEIITDIDKLLDDIFQTDALNDLTNHNQFFKLTFLQLSEKSISIQLESEHCVVHADCLVDVCQMSTKHHYIPYNTRIVFKKYDTPVDFWLEVLKCNFNKTILEDFTNEELILLQMFIDNEKNNMTCYF